MREAILPAYLVVQKTFDGNYLLFQSALEKVEGNTLSERCERIGGALLTPLEAKAEIKGASCLPCHTPKEYGGEDTEEIPVSVQEAKVRIPALRSLTPQRMQK